MEAATLDAHREFPYTDVFLSIKKNENIPAPSAARRFPAARTAGGDKRYASDAKHELKLRLDEDMLKENPLAEWSVRPVDAEIDD